MGVTDLTPTLPWGGSSNGQPQLPPGYGGSSSWLNYLASMFGPSSAQASPLHPNLDNPLSPPAAPPSGPGGSSVTMGPNQPPGLDQPTMDAARAALAAPGQGGPPAPAGGPSWFPGGSNTPMPWNGPTATPPPRPVNANAPSPAAQTVSSPAAPGVLSGGATSANRGAPMGAGPGASNRFGTVQYQTPNSIGNRAPIYTTGNLNLFGGGQPAGQGTPQGAPSQTPRPAVPGPMAAGGMSRAPYTMGPQQQGNAFPSQMGPFFPGQQAARNRQGPRMTSPYNYVNTNA
jgi:hypothetical protein